LAIARRSTEKFKEDVYKKYGNKVEILGEYEGANIPIEFVYHCEKHGDTYKSVNAKNVISKSFQPCRQCDLELKSEKGKISIKDKNYQYNRLKEYCESKGGKLISKEWTIAKDLYEIDCGISDHPHFFANADSLMNKPQWCPYCYGRSGNFNSKYKTIIESRDGVMLSNYVDGVTHVQIRCNKDGYIWGMYPSNIAKGRWCPICSMPYSERVPYDYLINNNYILRVQYTFNDLVGENNELLKYDFAILNKNNKLLGLLEIDDEEHRKNSNQLRRIKARIRDGIKDDYCKNNNIILYRLAFYRNKSFNNYDWYYAYIHNKLGEFLTKIVKINIA
jgi:hypothetical protein